MNTQGRSEEILNLEKIVTDETRKIHIEIISLIEENLKLLNGNREVVVMAILQNLLISISGSLFGNLILQFGKNMFTDELKTQTVSMVIKMLKDTENFLLSDKTNNFKH